MTARTKLLAAASALSVAAVVPAFADYSILEDSSLPSVVFIEFEGEAAEPTVIPAPASGVTQGGGSSSSSSSSGGGNSPQVIKPDEKAESNKGKSVEDRVNEKIAELEAGSPESVEEILIDNEIENRVLEGANLR
ncbi:MAG: hypothetical protein AAGF25_05410, partial [Pseudomonadota bacterium]